MQPPPFERYLLTLRLTAPARFHFLHGGVLRGLLSAALEQHELPVGVVPFAPESGRARFDTGEAYRFGLTLVGEERAAAGKILLGLERVGRCRRPGCTCSSSSRRERPLRVLRQDTCSPCRSASGTCAVRPVFRSFSMPRSASKWLTA